MISGWSKLQVPLGSESHGRGTFTLAPPSVSSRSLGKEQITSLCRSYGDEGGLEPHNDSILFPAPKTTLVENLLGALINATDILDGYAHSSRVSAAFKGFLEFEGLSEDHNLALALDPGHAHSPPHIEPLQLLSHERSSHGSSPHVPVSSLERNVPHASLRLASNADALHSVRSSSSSSALRCENISRGHRDLSVNTIRSADHGHSHLPASSEEDIMLQEARFKAFRNQTDCDERKGLRQASASSDGLMKIVDTPSKQAKDVNERQSHIALEGHAQSGKSWLFADITTLSLESSLFWGGIALSMFLAGVFFVTRRSRFSMGGQFQRPSVKRRILKSQWYGNTGSQSCGQRNFQMRISEFPKYPILEVDGDKKLLRFPANSGGTSTAFARSGSHLLGTTNATHGQPIRQNTDSKPVAQISTPRTAQGLPIRQTIQGGKPLLGQHHGPRKAQPYRVLHRKALSDVEWSPQSSLANDHRGTKEERNAEFYLPSVMSVKTKAHEKVASREGGLHGRRVSEFVQENVPIQRTSRMVPSKSRIDQSHWGKDDELDLDRRIQKLYETIQAVEEHRRASMLALEEERQRSMALEDEMAKQREASAMLGEEVRLLKESHSALLTSLRKKYSTSAAARTAADLVYQDWERHAAAEQ